MMPFSHFPDTPASPARSVLRNLLLAAVSALLTLVLFALPPLLLNRSDVSGGGGTNKALLVSVSRRQAEDFAEQGKKTKPISRKEVAPEAINRRDIDNTPPARPVLPEMAPVSMEACQPLDLRITDFSRLLDMTATGHRAAASSAAFGTSRRRYTLAEVDRTPLALVTPSPPYPYKARRLGMQGSVRVKFLVNTEGKVSDVSILEATPEGIFEETVKKTVPGWRFKAAVKDGQSVDSWVQTTIEFSLGG